MSRRIRSAVFAVAALLPVAGVAGPAGAQAPTVSISASPTEVRLDESFTVTGTTDCPSVGYTVTFSYTDHQGDQGTATATGTTDASGEFTQSITVPPDATAGEPADVRATVDCSGGAVTSEPVDITIAFYSGTLTVTPTAGEPGDEVTVSGTNCHGRDVVVVFSDGSAAEEVAVTLDFDDYTFTGTYTLPDVPGGDYFFAAACPGTEFADVPFALINEQVGSPTPSPTLRPTAPPTVPTPGQPDYTG